MSHDGNGQRHRTDCCKPRHKHQIKTAHIRKSQFCFLSMWPTSDFMGHHVMLGRELVHLTLVQTLIILLIWSWILCECYESKYLIDLYKWRSWVFIDAVWRNAFIQTMWSTHTALSPAINLWPCFKATIMTWETAFFHILSSDRWSGLRLRCSVNRIISSVLSSSRDALQHERHISRRLRPLRSTVTLFSHQH